MAAKDHILAGIEQLDGMIEHLETIRRGWMAELESITAEQELKDDAEVESLEAEQQLEMEA